MFGINLRSVFVFAVLLLAPVMFVAAQDLDDVTVGGKVTDTNGLAVVGASITTTSIETGETRTVLTDGDGVYLIVKLKPGTYKVKAAAKGFGQQETPGIPTISAQNVKKDFKLAPADVRAEQIVTVTDDDSPALDTTRTIVGGTITE